MLNVVLVLPRVIFDTWMMDDYKAIFKYSEEVEAMTKVLIETCKLHKFDGFVFEVWSQIAGAVKPESAVKLIRTMSKLMNTSLCWN